MSIASSQTAELPGALHHGANETHGTSIDYNVHDLLGIRLLNASIADVRAVGRELGLTPATLSTDPGITLRFVDEILLPSLRYVGRQDVCFNDHKFVILRSRSLSRARAQIDFGSIGATCEVICEKGLPEIPLLRPLMNVVMLARGIVPVHAAAFNFAGHGVLVTGWSHGSKTGTLLSFMAEGAEFVGDEWIYISARGNRMYGLPDHLEARPWYLRELPRYQRNVSAADRLRISVCDNLARVLAPLVPRSERHNSLMGKAVRHAHQLLSNQQLIDLRPLTLFGAEKCPLASSLDTVIVTVSHEAPDIVVEPTPVEHVAKQMAASFQFEQASLTSCYLKHLFAFPDRRNELLDQTDRVYTELALKALNGKTAYTMLHPYPVSTQALQRALLPLLGHPPNVGQQGPKSSRQSSGGSHS